MKNLFDQISLGWRVFIATSITITVLFAAAGWGLDQYAISVADESVRTEIRASIQSYEAVWKSRTQILSKASALMGTMSDVRATLMTRDPQTIRDSAQELWSRVSDASAVFLVLDAEGRLISSLGNNSAELPVAAVPLKEVASQFPRQLAGYLRNGTKLFYIVLTPVYVQTTNEPVLLNVFCAGFRIDDLVVSELKHLGPGSDFVFLSRDVVFASTLDVALAQTLSRSLSTAAIPAPERVWRDQLIISHQPLRDISGHPVAELCIARSYESVRESLSKLRKFMGAAWLLTIVIALLVSSYATTRLLRPIKLLDRAATEIASRNYRYRVPVKGTGELSRLAATFNHMCDSIEQAQSDLIRQEQIHTIGRLGSSLVHDLRNPLAAIYGGAEMLVDGHLPPDHTRRIATNIHRACQRVQELLRDLLNVSRGEARNPEFSHVRELLETTAESVDTETTGVHVALDVDEALEVFGDRTRIERVFMNLISNAVDAMPSGGNVLLRATHDDESIRVFVEDTGPGIPPEVRKNLFRPFVTAKRSGMGLGLALSRQTMIELGGDISVVTPRNGTGACFCVRFPKVRQEDPRPVPT